MNLRPYQRECLERILVRYKQGRRRLLVSLPTGTGKTVIFAKMPEFLAMKKRMLVLAHRQELLDQAAAKFHAVAPELRVGIEQGERSAPSDARVVLASVPTVGRLESRRLQRLDPEQFYVVVVDEAHHAVAPSYRRVFDHFGLFAERTQRLLVGFTATPRRGDKLTLADVFEEIAYAKSLPDMVRSGYLCTVRGWRVSSSVDLGGVRVRHGDFVESDLARAVDVPERNGLVVAAYRQIAAGRRGIVFCVNVAHVKALAAAFEDAQVRAAPVWGAMPSEDRQDALRRFREGRLDVLTNCNVLTEGFDEPRVDCVIMARPTHSQLLYAQMVGRGTRLHDTKSDVVVIDIADNSARHKLAGLNALFDLPESLDLGGHGAIETVDELDRLSEAMPWVDLGRVERAEELDHVAERVDLFRFEPPSEIAPFTRFAWCGTPDGGYRLNLADGEWIALREDRLGRWDATLMNPRAAARMPPPMADLASAIGAVDALVARDRERMVPLLTLDAHWRGQKPTEKQLELLRRRRIPNPNGLTRGQASWLITQSSRPRIA
ncbi:MAG: DEAD/DEAH box helicase [Polyangiaceae bacterium]|jgi:superfamily II DNA or RNA helicase